jgi:hypothetical protein
MPTCQAPASLSEIDDILALWVVRRHVRVSSAKVHQMRHSQSPEIRSQMIGLSKQKQQVILAVC